MRSRKSFIEQYAKQLTPRIILLVLLFFGAIFIFGVLIHEVLWEKETGLDIFVFQFITSHLTSPGLTALMTDITFFASSMFLQFAYFAVIALYLVCKDWKRAIEVLAVGMGGYMVNYSMKLFFHRPRPDHPLIAPLAGFSFPSGHAMSGFIFYGLMAYLVWKSDMQHGFKNLWIGVLIFFSLLIGFSRIYLRLHYTTDVMAGFCIGTAWLLLSITLMQKQKKRVDAELKP